MTIAARRLKYEDYADDLPALLEAVVGQHGPVELEYDGQVFRIELVENRKHDPEAFRTMLRRTAGAFKNVDTEALKRDLREMR